MAVQWSEIYADVCDILLESVPLSLGLLTQDQFFQIAAEVLLDFTAKSQINKHLYNQVLSFGVQEYPEHSLLNDLQGCLAAQTFIYESSDFYLSNTNRSWEAAYNIGNPESYRQDSIETKTVQITPAPQYNGNQVTIVGGGGGYGVIAAVASYTDFTITCDPSTPAGYGVICGANGNPFLDALNPGYGVTANMIPSTNNLTMQGTALPYQIENIGPETFVELVPDSFTPYLKYGILARVFGSDNELRDEQKAMYCQSRYSEGLAITAAIMCDVYEEQ